MDSQNEEEAGEEYEPHEAARPMRVIMDRDGCTWLCDASVDETKDLKDQGCWRCEDLPFTRDD